MSLSLVHFFISPCLKRIILKKRVSKTKVSSDNNLFPSNTSKCSFRSKSGYFRTKAHLPSNNFLGKDFILGLLVKRRDFTHPCEGNGRGLCVGSHLHLMVYLFGGYFADHELVVVFVALTDQLVADCCRDGIALLRLVIRTPPRHTILTVSQLVVVMVVYHQNFRVLVARYELQFYHFNQIFTTSQIFWGVEPYGLN